MAKIRGRGKVGDVVKIDLSNGTFGYGRVLPEPLMAFYDLQSHESLLASNVVKSSVLFILCVMYNSIKSDKWHLIGKAPLEDILKIEPKFFLQDHFTKEFSIYYHGRIMPATRDDCIGLERAAVWENIHIEDPLRNYFDGVPDPSTEILKLA